MKFKLFGIQWNFWPLAGAVWAFIGMTLIGYTFALPDSPWWLTTIWALTFVIWISTAESVTKKLEGGIN